jgi:hypothetical protein
MKVQLVTLYRVSHWQRYGAMVRGNVTSVYPPLPCMFLQSTYHPTYALSDMTYVNCYMFRHRGAIISE